MTRRNNDRCCWCLHVTPEKYLSNGEFWCDDRAECIDRHDRQMVLDIKRTKPYLYVAFKRFFEEQLSDPNRKRKGQRNRDE